MNRLIKLTAVLFLAFFLSLGVRKAFAVDLTITCVTHGPCNMTPNPGDALFNVANMLPGDTEKQTITVYNEDEENECRNLTLNITKTKEDPSDFADEVLYTAIVKDGVNKFGDEVSGEASSFYLMQDLFDQGSVDLGSVPAAGSSVIDWYATFEKLAGNHFQNAETKFDFDIYFECNSFEREQKLTIAKFNDQDPIDQSPGFEITYHLVITALGGPVYNVVVTDLPPEGFSYISGSYSADINGSSLGISEPTYASPGKWDVGDMDQNDVVTLSYKAKISDSKKPGLYKDIAWAYGCNSNTPCAPGDDGFVVLASSVDSLKTDPGIITGNHVGTKINIVKDETSSVNINIVKEETVGEVLGAMASLPATGAKTIWIIIAGGMLVLGSYLIIKGLKEKGVI